MNSNLLTPFCCLAKKSNVHAFSMKKFFLALFCMGAIAANAQVSSYAATSTTIAQTYTAITTGGGATGVFGTNVNATLDNAVSAAIPLGFNFNFNGKVYTTCYVSFNGFITFGSAPSGTDFTPLSSATAHEGVISAYGIDLKGVNVDVLRQTQGTFPNRTFTIQWTAYRVVSLTPPINMQIILHESDVTNVVDPGVVDIKYNSMAPNVANTGLRQGQVGLRGENNTDFNNFYHNGAAWPTGSPIFVKGGANNAWINTRFSAACITAPTKLSWTPPTCFAPRAVKATPVSITSNSATLTWTAPNPLPANGYDYLVTTTALNNINVTYPIASTPPTGSVGAGVTTTPVSLLSPNTLYYIYVRSNCGTAGGWSAAGSFTTLCTPITVLPYTQDFESGYVVPAIPPCNKVEDLTGEVAPYGRWITNNAIPTPGPYGFVTKHAQCTTGGSFDNNTTYFIEGIQLTGGVSYRLSYKYGGSTEFATTEQSMTVAYYTAPYVAAPSTFLVDHPSVKAGPFTNVINFTPASSGVYYIGFNDYSLAGNATLLLDDIDVRPTTCFAPVQNPATGITSGSAFISWSAATPAPGSGYQYYYNTSNTPPTGSTTPSGSTAAGVLNATLGGLSPSTTYYVWVRSSCGSGDFSNWSVLISFTTQVGAAPPTCVPSGVGFSQDPNGITNVTFSNVNNTTGIESTNYGDYSYLIGYAGRGTSMPISITYRTGFTYDTTIWVDWDNNGTFIPGEVVYTGNSAATIPATLNGTIAIPIGATLGAHRMRIGGIDFGPLTDPCRTGTWQAYEDYTLYVTTPPPAITLSIASATVCQGTPTAVNITSTLGNYTSYTWEPTTGVTGTAPNFILNPTSTTTYVLSGFNGATFHRNTVTVTITVKATPTPVSITPSSMTVCQNATTLSPLTVTGGQISGVAIYSENFNGTAPGWLQTNTTVNATVAGNEALAAWGLFPDGYAPFFATYHSNDNSQFAFTESDAPGITSTTDTTLISPAINLTGYTTATLNFYEFYMQFNNSNEFGIVEVTTDNGTTWTTLLTHDGSVDVGTETNFSLATLDLTSYALASNTIKIRFRYHATWDWGWAIDNFAITGSGPSSITWAPIAGLYNDASAAVAYTGDIRSTVYPRPTTTTAYTATATAFGCPVTSTPVTITVTPINGGTMAVTSQTVCGGAAASPIVLSAPSVLGTVLYWQYADDALFTVNLTVIPGSAGLTTLTSALIGTIPGPGPRYYRAVVAAGGCTNAYSPTHTISIPTTTWNGATWSAGAPNSTTQAIFSGNYSSSANLTACSIQVLSGTITINSGHTLTVQNGVTVSNAARLIFEDDASLVQVNNTANVGDITYKRITTPMRKYDYTYWSSPVNAQILASFSPLTLSDKYFTFNTTTYQWTAIAAPGSTPMTVGRGYIIRAPETFNLTPTVWPGAFGYNGVTHGGGVPNNGTYIVSVGHNSATNNLDCIGNPYPSAISANLFISDAQNAAALGASGTTIYFWTHNTPITAYNYNGADYASYNYTGGIGTGAAATSPLPCTGCNFSVPSGNIAAGQAFMVKTATAGSVYFKNTMRLTGLNTQFYRMADQEDPIESLERNRLWLELSNIDGAYKQMLAGYIESATNGIDPGFDGELVEAGNPISIYSIAEGQKLTIQGKALPFNSADEIPLGYRTAVAGTFQITLPMTDGLFVDQDVYLNDTLLNIVHDLKQGGYSFATETGTFDTRFVLRFVNTTLSTEHPLFDQNAVVVYKNNHSVFVETSNIKMKSVKIYDLRGRLITQKDAINDTKVEFNNLNAAQQVLMVQVTSTDNVTVTKKIVY
jgi:hypothetical protein